ncbi:MAG: alpha/beta hydrolase [Alcanivoracaceae bacterium]|nr:alpha/beta hydrolase [Alcanivoracaceae bacterium]
MSWREEVFEVPNEGIVLRGIVTRPDTGRCDLAVILLPAGLKDRVGPHRLYVQLARQLVRPGVLVLRLDAAGIGESDGELDTGINARHYRRIQSGLFVDDTLAAMRALTAREGVRHFVLGGLCGGAISAQLAAAAAPSAVAGVLSLSHVAVLDEDQPASARTRSEVVSNNRAYLRKLFSAHAWRRLVAGESEWREIWQNINGLWHLLLEKAGIGRRHWANENPAFFSSFRQLQQAGIEHLMLFGQRDARWTAFRELVVEGFLGGTMQGKGYRIEVIAEANHEFYLRHWSQSVLDQASDWLAALIESADDLPGDAAWAAGSGKHTE